MKGKGRKFNIETLHDYFLEEVPPLVYAAPGGLYVEIDGETLRSLRESKSISLGELAKALGVSRRTISKYESGMNATVDAALKLEEILDAPIACPINMIVKFERPGPADESANDLRDASGMERDALGALVQIGFDVFRTTRAPFNALSREDDNKVLTGVSDVSEIMLKKAKFMSSLADVAGTYSLFIVKGAHQSKAIGNTILLESEELKKIDDSDQLLDLYRKEPRKADTGK
jgi:putative transcriptional regulator